MVSLLGKSEGWVHLLKHARIFFYEKIQYDILSEKHT